MRDKGDFVESGQNDILTKVLGPSKHLGRVKIKGEYVNQREVFMKPLGGFKSVLESQVLLEREEN